MIYKLTLGDWSEDGHRIHEDFYFDCNYDVHKIRQAYKDTCKKLGVVFDVDDCIYMDLEKISIFDDRAIWTNYEENDISTDVFNILKNAGVLKGVNYEIRLNKSSGKERYFIESVNDCATVVMNFIAISMPDDFTYTLIDPEPINGYWNDELNDMFGYGLFDF